MTAAGFPFQKKRNKELSKKETLQTSRVKYVERICERCEIETDRKLKSRG